MTDKPEIRFLEITKLTAEDIVWIFDKDGKRTGFGQTVQMTKEELEKTYPEIEND